MELQNKCIVPPEGATVIKNTIFPSKIPIIIIHFNARTNSIYIYKNKVNKNYKKYSMEQLSLYNYANFNTPSPQLNEYTLR